MQYHVQNHVRFSLLVSALALAFIGTVGAQTAPLGPPCIVATNASGSFTAGDGSGNATIGSNDANTPGQAVAVGCGSFAGTLGTANGAFAQAGSTGSVAIGALATVTAQTSSSPGDAGIAVGAFSHSEGTSIAMGSSAKATDNAFAFGTGAEASFGSWALGQGAVANNGSVAIGGTSNADSGSVAIGGAANATAGNAVALGRFSVADRFGTVSVGAVGSERQIVNVAAGTTNTDAATIGQLAPVASSFGGGAGLFGGILTPPAYLFRSGVTYNNVGDALADLDARVTGLEAGDTGGGTDEPFFDATAPAAPASGSDAVAEADNSVAIGSGSVADREGTVSVGSAGAERQVTNVADGTMDTDAANIRQVQAGDEWAVSTSRSYTDARVAPIETRIGGIELRLDGLDRRLDGIDAAVRHLGRRVSKSGAIGTAMGLMAAASAANAGHSVVSTGFSAAVATYDGENAVAIGFNTGWRTKNGRPVAATFGAATAGGDASAGVGFSVGLR